MPFRIEGGKKAPSLVEHLRDAAFPRIKDVRVTLFLGGHFSHSDAEEILAQMEGCDVFVPEMACWETHYEEIANRVSRGDVSIPEGGFTELIDTAPNPFYDKLFSGIAGRGTRIAFADIPQGSDLDIPNTVQAVADLPQDIRTRQWSRYAAQQLYAARMRKVLASNDEREDHIASHLAGAVARTAAYDPQKENRTSLNVMLALGSDHHGIVKKLENELGTSVGVITQLSGRFRTYVDEMNDALVRGNDVPEEAADGALTELLIFNGMRGELAEKAQERFGVEKFVRTLAERMDDAERERLHTIFLSKNTLALTAFVTLMALEKGVE